MDEAQPAPAIDPSIHLAMPAASPSPSMIATVATARFPMGDSGRHPQSFPPPLFSILFPEHHWRDYPHCLTR
uniref:Uncharacterized protein n=1 Tax=Romanomermis culicivorax TaxID=13658 RepID=A0A915K4G6_ROMCU